MMADWEVAVRRRRDEIEPALGVGHGVSGAITSSPISATQLAIKAKLLALSLVPHLNLASESSVMCTYG
jgi:hypothetical protein